MLIFFIVLGNLLLAGIFNYLFSFLLWYPAVNAGINIPEAVEIIADYRNLEKREIIAM